MWITQQFPDSVQHAVNRPPILDLDPAYDEKALDQLHDGVLHLRGEGWFSEIALQVGPELQQDVGREASQLSLSATLLRTKLVMLALQQPQSEDFVCDLFNLRRSCTGKRNGARETSELLPWR